MDINKMDFEKRMHHITRNTQEITTLEELREMLRKKEEKNELPTVYLGTAITGRPHIGYYVWVLKLADFLNAGFKVKLLLADLHGALDNTPWELLEKRFKYYSAVIPLMFESIGADIGNFEIVKGSDFQFDKKYFFDVLKFSTLASVHDCRKAGSEVVKQDENPKLSGLIYPMMQALDEQYLGVDIQYGGIDQRKILMFAREYLPKLGYESRVEVMTPLIPGLVGKKMSASDPKSKIDLLDDEGSVNEKIRAAYCEEGIIEENGLLAFLKYVVMTIKQDKGELFVIERPEKWGGNTSFRTYEEIEKAYAEKQLHPADLKNALAKEINHLLAPFRHRSKELNELSKWAYEN